MKKIRILISLMLVFVMLFQLDIPAAAEQDVPAEIVWNGKTKLKKNTNYIITEKTFLRTSMTLPAGSTLTIKKNGQLYLTKNGEMFTAGEIIVEKGGSIKSQGNITVRTNGIISATGNISFSGNANLNVQGRMSVAAGAKLTVTGVLTFGKQSETYIQGTLTANTGSKIRVSGMVETGVGATAKISADTVIYESGIIYNSGRINFLSKSNVKLTGEIQNDVYSTLYISGGFSITKSGRFNVSNTLSIKSTAEVMTSGLIIFEDSAKYSDKGRITQAKGSVIIDYRKDEPVIPGEDLEDPDFDPNTVQIKGIDVSWWQGVIDWKKVASSGVKFAMIRCSAGLTKDGYFDANVKGAQENGIEVGVYHYSYATTKARALEEAQFMLDIISGHKITYPVVLDIEDSTQIPLTKTALTNIALVYLTEIESAGYYPMIYSYKNFLNGELNMDKLKAYDVWLAQWAEVPDYTGSFGIWQYSSKGSVKGITGDVDLNIAYKDYAYLIRQKGLN